MSTPSLEQLLRFIDRPESVDDLQAYFGSPTTPAGTLPPYTGGRFDLLGGGGDREDIKNRITTEDLFAVELLDVQVPAEVGLDLLEGPLAAPIGDHLATIPTGVGIDHPDAANLLADAGPADRAWHFLRQSDGMGWVTVNKLLARKRPELIPVYDRVVHCAVRPPNGKLWRWLVPMFDPSIGEQPADTLTGHLTARQRAAELPTAISALRVLDVLIWMHHHPRHRATRCPGMDWPT